jgi:hypothetical protein
LSAADKTTGRKPLPLDTHFALHALIEARDADYHALVGTAADQFDLVASLHAKGDGAGFDAT